MKKEINERALMERTIAESILYLLEKMEKLDFLSLNAIESKQIEEWTKHIRKNLWWKEEHGQD